MSAGATSGATASGGSTSGAGAGRRALIGHSGFVGTTLQRQARFTHLYRSSNAHELAGERFELVVCAAASAKKWVANADPAADLDAIERLVAHLQDLSATRFVLVSTVDVFADSRGRHEGSAVDESALSPYGRHRLRLERAVLERFPHALVVRLPGLVGPGLVKNAVFDLAHRHRLEHVDPDASLQYYPMVNLWWDIEVALRAGLSLVHLVAPPLTSGDVARECFGITDLVPVPGTTSAAYDLHTRHAALYGRDGPYRYSRDESLLAIRAYAQALGGSVGPGGPVGPGGTGA